jgi:hypothetical protein
MNTDQQINLAQKFVVLLSGYFISKGIGDKALWEILSSAIVGLVTWYISHRWNAAPATSNADASTSNQPPTTASSGFVRLPMLFFTLTAVGALFAALIVGCAHIQPGQDPIIVNTERVQTIAAPTFDLVLETDHSNRAFWETKAPAFHDFCEWLRQTQTAQLADGTPTNVQRAIAMQLNLDKVKLDYKASKVSSNAVLEAIAALESAEQQANAWLVVITNPAPTTIQPLGTPGDMIEVRPLYSRMAVTNFAPSILIEK